MASTSTPSLRFSTRHDAHQRSPQQQSTAPLVGMSVQLPQRFQGINEEEEVDYARTTLEPIVQEQSLLSMMAQAGDINQFSERWQQGEGSGSEEDVPPPQQEEDNPEVAGSSTSRHKKRLSNSKLVKTLLKPSRKDSQPIDLMTHSQILPPREQMHDLSEKMTKDDIKLRAPVLDGRLRAQARAVKAETGSAASSARNSSESLALKRQSKTLADALAGIFGLESPEDVLAEYPCWFLQSNLLQGFMYITTKHICFYAYLQKTSGTTLKSGYLSKRGMRNPIYDRQWYSLKGTTLTAFAKKTSKYFQRSIDLTYAISAEITTDKEEPGESTSFTITTDTRIYQLRADSPASAQEWVKQIQKVIFRSHNDGDSVKVSLPISNIVNVTLNPVVGSTDTVRLQVIDAQASQNVDDYFFTFFSKGKDMFEKIQTLTGDNTANKQEIDQVKTTVVQSGVETSGTRRPVMSRGRSSFERTRMSRPDTNDDRTAARPKPQDIDLSASQILTGDQAFQQPTLQSSRTSSRSSQPQTPTLSSPAPEATSSTRPRPIASTVQQATAFAGYVREQGKRMSSYLSSSPRDYYEKFSGALAGGKRHYNEAEGLAPEDRVNDPEDEMESAEHELRFQKHFALPASEQLKAVFYTSLHRVLPLYGKIYLGTRYLCFRSLLYGTKTKIVIPLQDIDNVEKERGFRLGYPGMVLVLRGHEELFFDFRNGGLRDDCAVTILRALDQISSLKAQQEESADDAAAENQLLAQMRHQDDEMPFDEASDSQGIQFDDTSASMIDFKPKGSLRIVCLTIGSRGDVQPYIALCKGFLAEGHRPMIATHVEFGDWVKSHGIDFTPVGGNPAELMRLCVELGMFTPRFIYETNSKFRGWLDDLLQTSWQACQGCDLLIESPSAMAGIHIAEALGIPYFRAFTMMWTPTRAYPHAFAAMNHKMGGTYNIATYGIFDNVFWQMTANQINRWRTQKLGISPTTSRKLQQNRVPFLYNFSPSFVAPPMDFSSWVKISGYWFLDEGEDWTPPADLLAFIRKARADNMKLVYIGFGSIVVSDSRSLTKSVVDAVVSADVRCILSKGWSDRLESTNAAAQAEIDLPSCIYKIGAAPHDWLFKQVDAAVHHGGAGTTGASLRAGVPTVIKPFFGDQFFSAIRVVDLGVGLRIDHISQNVLGRALWIATHDDRMRNKAKLLGERIRAEDGVATAIETIYREMSYAHDLIMQKAARPATSATDEEAALSDDEQELDEWEYIGAKEISKMKLSDADEENFSELQQPVATRDEQQRTGSRYGVYQLGSLMKSNRFL